MKLTAFAMCAFTLAVAGCTSNPMPATGNSSTVSVRANIGDEMIARRIDGKSVDNLTMFTLTGTEHTMEVGILMGGQRDSYRRCLATLTYADFKSGAHYSLVQPNVSKGIISVSLVDEEGRSLAQTNNVACI